jgi:phosphoribosylglycinamide formyltransferase-1
MTAPQPTRFAVLASHEGSTLQAVLDACQQRHLNATVNLVISNNSDSGAIRRAREVGVDVAHISGKTHPSDTARDDAMLRELRGAGVDWVLLLGYMKKLGPRTLNRYRGRILNTHPALLPKYGGLGYFGRRVHEAVLAAGETESGATIHAVDSEYDTGPLIAQVRVSVHPDDTVDSLEARVKHAEQQLLIATLTELVNTREASAY